MRERSTLLALGITLTAIRCVGIMLFSVLLGGLGIGLSGLLLFHPEPDNLLPFLSIAIVGGGLIVLGVLAYYGLSLVACIGAWRGSHGWTWVLAILSGLGLLHAGPLGLTINGITLFGCVQALGGSESSRAQGL